MMLFRGVSLVTTTIIIIIIVLVLVINVLVVKNTDNNYNASRNRFVAVAAAYSLSNSLKTTTGSKQSRYFVTEILVPPIPKLVPSSTTTTQQSHPKQHHLRKQKQQQQQQQRQQQFQYNEQNNLYRYPAASEITNDICTYCSNNNIRNEFDSQYNSNNVNNNNYLMERKNDIIVQSSSSSSSLSDTWLPVVYTNDPKIVSQWLSENIPSNGCTLGFDIESVPRKAESWLDIASHASSSSNHRGPSVVQLATTERALVVQLARPNNLRPNLACLPILQSVLCDDTIVKVGVSIDQDLLDLMDYPAINQGMFLAKSRFDLSRLREKMKGNTPGLQTLAASVLGLHLPKSTKLAMSDWSTVPLSLPQLQYCARDAWVSAAIVQELELRDPTTFSTEALIQSLRNEECPMNVLYQRYRKRKYAKFVLSTLLAPYKGSSTKTIISHSINGGRRNDFRQHYPVGSCNKKPSSPFSQAFGVPTASVSSSSKQLYSTTNNNNNESINNNNTPTKRDKKKERRKKYSYPNSSISQQQFKPSATIMIPQWKLSIIKELKEIMNTKIHDPADIYDIRRLGLQLVAVSTSSTNRPHAATFATNHTQVV